MRFLFALLTLLSLAVSSYLLINDLGWGWGLPLATVANGIIMIASTKALKELDHA